MTKPLVVSTGWIMECMVLMHVGGSEYEFTNLECVLVSTASSGMLLC